MIKILAKNFSKSVSFLCGKFDGEFAQYDVCLTNDVNSAKQTVSNAVDSSCQSLIIVGDVGASSTLFSETLNLAMFYDKFAEKNILQYCKLSKTDIPPQHVLDKLCSAPEAFNHYASAYGYQCACYGEYNKCHVFFIPDDVRECAVLDESYI
ncbi:MAG: hypothetical protein NC099_02735, partial [Corallococcus sp.]|nr:hypothetical protein [Corallococcus sp.]